MRAAAQLIAERAGERTVCTTLRSDPPLALRPTAAGSDEASVHLVGSAAGPVGGDTLSLSVTARPRARLAVRSVAATTVLPGPGGTTTARPRPMSAAGSSMAPQGDPTTASHLDVVVEVHAGAALRWLTEPTILVAGCDHRSSIRISLDISADLVWREVVVLGRHGEGSGSLLQRLRVDAGGPPLLRNDLAVGPRWPGSQGPAGVGSDTRAVGMALLVGTAAANLPPASPSAGRGRAATLPLAPAPGMPRAVLLSAVASEAGAVVAWLDDVLGGVGPV